MKKLIVLLLPLIILISCRNDKAAQQPPSTPRIINPSSSSANQSEAVSNIIEEEDQNFLVPMIPLPPEDTLLLTNDVNLDFDTEDEQIILTRRTVDGKTVIYLYVVDYNNDKMAFYSALETGISPDSTEGISILIQDLTGNNLNEIIITGFTKNENHTLDVFYNNFFRRDSGIDAATRFKRQY